MTSLSDPGLGARSKANPGKLALGVVALLAVVVLGVIDWRQGWTWPFAGSSPQTTGTIYVSGPQVYTRGRLVNDRYREDAWLQEQLEASKDLIFGVTGQVRTLGSQRADEIFVRPDMNGLVARFRNLDIPAEMC